MVVLACTPEGRKKHTSGPAELITRMFTWAIKIEETPTPNKRTNEMNASVGPAHLHVVCLLVSALRLGGLPVRRLDCRRQPQVLRGIPEFRVGAVDLRIAVGDGSGRGRWPDDVNDDALGAGGSRIVCGEVRGGVSGARERRKTKGGGEVIGLNGLARRNGTGRRDGVMRSLSRAQAKHKERRIDLFEREPDGWATVQTRRSGVCSKNHEFNLTNEEKKNKATGKPRTSGVQFARLAK